MTHLYFPSAATVYVLHMQTSLTEEGALNQLLIRKSINLGFHSYSAPNVVSEVNKVLALNFVVQNCLLERNLWPSTAWNSALTVMYLI